MIFALILVVVIYVAKLVIDMLPLPEQVKSIALIVLGLIGLVLILQRLGAVSGMGF